MQRAIQNTQAATRRRSWGQRYALAERGYKAIGGEALLLGLPLFWYLTETTIRDTVRDFRKGGRRK